MSKYITENERYIIETMLKDGKNVKDIAVRIGKHFTTVYREIKRGTIILKDTHLRDYEQYCADVGQRKQEEKGHNKGIVLKIGSDFETMKKIENLIINQKYSPYAVSVELKKDESNVSLSTATIYSYIHNKVFKNISDKNLSYKVNKKDEKVKRRSYKMLDAKTIEERSKDVLKRDVYGHWEMDTVVSGKNDTTCLLVLSERMTRQEIVKKMPNRKADTILNEINKIERALTYPVFKSIFKTITCDNGVEFAKYKDIEQSCTVVGKRTDLYFCHPFCSSERGTNENTNKLIRKFIPKGSSISKFSDDDIQAIEDFINNYPRKLFGGLSTNEYKAMLGIA